jgi:hypothetical protein
MRPLGHRHGHHPSTTCAVPSRLGAAVFTVLLLVLSSAPLAGAVSAQSPLGPFRIDPDLSRDVVLNAGQGLGQCHWIDRKVLSKPYVSWAYDSSDSISGWSAIEPQPGAFHWEPLDGEIAKARLLGKRIWIELHTAEGQTPQWARQAGVALVGSRGGTPAPWNETYQRLLRRAVHAMAARYDGNPTVEAINLMAGGCYGEMVICAPQADRQAWEQAGYTDERFIEAVKQIIDLYLEEEHQWEDGSRSHGFLETPVVLQLGSGLYGHSSTVIQTVVDYAMSKYGMRLWLKYNGLGGSYDMGWLYEQYDHVTRVGYEPVGNSLEFLMKPGDYVRAALDQHASYLCLQDTYFDIADPKWEEARGLAARYLGTHIILQSYEAPERVAAGQEYILTTNWVNRGTTPLMRPERQGVKDVPASYEILIAFVDPATGEQAFEHSFSPAVPTTRWYAAQPVHIEQTIPIPSSVPAAEYELSIALVNPSLPADDEQRYFHLTNADLSEDKGRYTIGPIAVQKAQPTTTTAPTAAPESGVPAAGSGNWLSRLLRSVVDWLRNLFSGGR